MDRGNDSMTIRLKTIVAATSMLLLLCVLAPVVPATAEPVEADSPLVQLGQALFFDTQLSEPAGQACVSCHDPARAFAHPDKNTIVANGSRPDLVGSRNVPSILYASYSPSFHYDEEEGLFLGGQFHDGRASTLEEQAKGPFLNPLEMANRDPEQVVEKVRKAAYAPLFDTVFGQGALSDTGQAYERIADALAAFQRTVQFRPFSSKYDAYLAGKTKLNEREMRGLRLFEAENKGNCAACHPSRPDSDGQPPLFTDFSYDNLGVPRNPDNPFYLSKHNPAGEHFVDRGLGTAVGKRGEDGKFKVPTLRNIAQTGPYMHNGYFRTLPGVLAFYNDRDRRPVCADNRVPEARAFKEQCWPSPEVIANVNRDELGDLGMTQTEMGDIVAFLETLTDGWQPGSN
jgi:cytochrome c peroxidase